MINMNAYDALMRAADHIEEHPEKYDFGVSTVYRDGEGGDRLCMLGRIGQIADVHVHENVNFVAMDFLKVPDASIFYERIWDLMGRPAEGTRALCRPHSCAAAMRQYADAYHEADGSVKKDVPVRREGIPVEVCELFQPTFSIIGFRQVQDHHRQMMARFDEVNSAVAGMHIVYAFA